MSGFGHDELLARPHLRAVHPAEASTGAFAAGPTYRAHSGPHERHWNPGKNVSMSAAEVWVAMDDGSDIAHHGSVAIQN